MRGLKVEQVSPKHAKGYTAALVDFKVWNQVVLFYCPFSWTSCLKESEKAIIDEYMEGKTKLFFEHILMATSGPSRIHLSLKIVLRIIMKCLYETRRRESIAAFTWWALWRSCKHVSRRRSSWKKRSLAGSFLPSLPCLPSVLAPVPPL